MIVNPYRAQAVKWLRDRSWAEEEGFASSALHIAADEIERLPEPEDQAQMERIVAEMIQKDIRIMMLERAVSEKHMEIERLKATIGALTVHSGGLL